MECAGMAHEWFNDVMIVLPIKNAVSLVAALAGIESSFQPSEG